MKIGFIPMGPIGEYFRENLPGSLDWVRQIGLDGVEGAARFAEPLGLSVEETRTKLDGMGLGCPAQGGVKFSSTDDEIREVAETAAKIGAKYVVDYFAPFADRNDILQHCEYFMRAGRICREEGVTFLYHNHDHEMKKHDGVRGLDILLENTDPELVKLELDVAWVTFGGVNPVEIITKNPERYPLLHMKDFAELHPGSPEANGVRKEAIFSEVGTGVVDTAGVVEVAKRVGVEWLVIEQDRMNALEPRQSLETSAKNLRALV